MELSKKQTNRQAQLNTLMVEFDYHKNTIADTLMFLEFMHKEYAKILDMKD